MRVVLCLAVVWALAHTSPIARAAESHATSPAPIEFSRSADRLEIRAGGAPVATYVFGDPEIPRPYFAHLFAPGGVQVSRRHPPKEGIDATDHALMHPGLWLAFGDLSGADSWRLKSSVKLIELAEEPTTEGGVGRFAVRLKYMSADGKNAVAEELCRYTIAAARNGYLLVSDSTFTPAGEEAVFGDQEEMGLGVRLASGLTVKAGGRLLNSEGRVNENEVWGRTADWCDYEGAVGEDASGGGRAGILIVPDPANFRPSWFHARDYGVLVANPFGRRAFGAGEASRVVVAKGESLRLRFAVLLHASSAEAPFDAAAAHREIVKQFE
jgi:hypothetical protein